ncbi:unnamed protein product [Trifolium pratense]|uniref:Uncharacterized protein n=1 Tax=Trifolium pratense TaxID=57577 RepID=A0ACB0MA40_TRIPR|nr:unnamed protein product [Trifolium pratense]
MEKSQNGEHNDDASSICGYDSLHHLLKDNLKPHHFQEVNRLLTGLNCGKALETIALPDSATALSVEHGFDIQAFHFHADKEVLREPRVVRVGLIQNSIAIPTTSHFVDQKKAIFEKLKPIIDAAGSSGVNILCLQEAWMMPFAFCTREKRWCEFAEPVDGESTKFLQSFALKYNMVIISPILERDINHGEVIWNTAVVIGNHGNIIGIHRKVTFLNFLLLLLMQKYFFQLSNEHTFRRTIYQELETSMRAHIMLKEILVTLYLKQHLERLPLIYVMARNAAIANSYYVASINRVGTETFPNPFTSGDGKPAHADFGHFYGSSYISAPDASCTPSLSRNRDGLLVTDMDLNLCRQYKDKWGFRMTARYELYAETLAQYVKPEFEPQVIRDPLLHKRS